MNRVKLVQFSNGKYGIEKGFFQKEYLYSDSYFVDWLGFLYKECQFNTEAEALEALKEYAQKQLDKNPRVIKRKNI